MAGTKDDRSARVAALRKQQKGAERRKTVLVVGAALLVAAGVIAVPAARIVRDHEARTVDIARIGVPIDLAQCDPEVQDPSPPSDQHVEGHVDYATVPPSGGPHYGTPASVNDRGFYTTKDSPPVEVLVHNLEHGYTVLWYDPALAGDELDELRTLAKRLRNDPQYVKFIAAPWDTARGAFPAGKPLALSHWGVEHSYRQFCGKVSGPAALQFLNAHPTADSPEPKMP